MPAAPTILLVHAHPDDEASTTGGTIARYAAEGARVVLVTCTNGEYGNSAAGHAPDHDEHDSDEVVAHRLAELEASCSVLGVSRLVLLGYHDSGMMGWAQNDQPGSFWSTPIAEAAARLAAKKPTKMTMIRNSSAIARLSPSSPWRAGHPVRALTISRSRI